MVDQVEIHRKAMSGVVKELQRTSDQLFSEFFSIFPNNHIEYFVSYYEYYKKEAYVTQSDTYI